MFTTYKKHNKHNKTVVRLQIAAIVILTFASLYIVPLALAGPSCGTSATGC